MNSFLALSKPRISLMVAITAFAGYRLAQISVDQMQQDRAWWICAAVLIMSSSASAFNQIMERNLDAKMRRTSKRPLVMGSISMKEAWIFGILSFGLGLSLMQWKGNLPSVGLLLLTFFSYVLLYTPLKQTSTLNTLIGAVPGALPPLIGWVAVTSKIEMGGAILFAILFFWQLPHFLAIAWLYREDYRNAGMSMITNSLDSGAFVGRHAFLYCFALIPVAMFPTLTGMAGNVYFFGSIFLGLFLLLLTFRFLRSQTQSNARQVLLGSVIYLPALLTLLMMDSM
ncbi:MAG: heme o synthase [Bdellovibrionota bacterium]